MSLLVEYFKPPRRDPRDKEPGSSTAPETEEDFECNGSDDEDVEIEGSAMSATVLEGFIEDLTEAERYDALALENNTVLLEDSEDEDVEDIETLFGMGDCSKMFLEFREMLSGGNGMDRIRDGVIRVMEMASLGRLEKGSMSVEGRFKSLPGRWFNAKNHPSRNDGNTSMMVDGRFIQRDSLITVKAKRGKTESIEYYRVLGIFSKHYNKWYLHWDDDKVTYDNNSKQYKILARMVEKDGPKFKEVELVAGGHWSPRCVYVLRYMSEIVSVESVLGTDTLSL